MRISNQGYFGTNPIRLERLESEDEQTALAEVIAIVNREAMAQPGE